MALGRDHPYRQGVRIHLTDARATTGEVAFHLLALGLGEAPRGVVPQQHPCLFAFDCKIHRPYPISISAASLSRNMRRARKSLNLTLATEQPITSAISSYRSSWNSRSTRISR